MGLFDDMGMNWAQGGSALMGLAAIPMEWWQTQQAQGMNEQLLGLQMGLLGAQGRTPEGDVVPGWGRWQRELGSIEKEQARAGQMLKRRTKVGQRGLSQMQAKQVGGVGQLGEQALGAFGTLAGNLEGGYGQWGGGGLAGELGRGYGAFSGDITGGYDERLTTGMGMMEGMGAQERKDLLKTYGELGASQQANLAARGMGGTTIGTNIAQGNVREQQDAMNRLTDYLARQKLDVYGQFSGEGLLAKERMGQLGLGARERLGMGGLAMQQELGMQGINLADQMRMRTLGEEDRWDMAKWQFGQDMGAQQMSLMQGYGGLERGTQADITNQMLGVLSGVQVPYPQQTAWSDYTGTLGEIGNTMQMKDYMDQQQQGGGLFGLGGLGGAGAGAGAGAAGSLISSLAFAPMGPLGWGMAIGAGALGGYGADRMGFFG